MDNKEKAREAENARRKAKQKKPMGMRIFLGFCKVVAVCICLAVMVGSVVAVMASMYLVKATENDSQTLDLYNINLKYTTILYAPVYNEDGTVAEGEYVEYQRLYNEENRIWVKLGDISPNLQNAFIAIEDKDFYKHHGFSFKRNVFSVLNEVSYALTGTYIGGRKQGASTINQQLIKNLTGEDESSGAAGYIRKITEIFRAVAMDTNYSKDDILEAYLNTIPFTGNIGGVEAAANKYFGVSASEVTLAQAASIAAITNNPVKYSPITNPENNLDRRNQILYNMLEQGLITQADYDTALAEPLRLYEQKTSEVETRTSSNSWYTDVVIDEVINDLLEKNPNNEKNWDKTAATNYFYSSGLRIYLTVNAQLQTLAEETMVKHEFYPDLKYENWQPTDTAGNVILNADGTEPEPKTIRPEAAMAIINYDGELVAVVGSMNLKEVDRGFNRATEGTRQVGSTMKGVAAYPLGIEYDAINYSTPVVDQAFKTIQNANGTTREWPKNFEGEPSGKTYLAYNALAQSLNTVAVWVGDWVGARNMYDFAHDVLQIDSIVMPDDVDLAPMVLGATTQGVTPYQLAGAYMMYGDGGYHTNLHSYTTITSYNGETIMDKDVVKVQALSDDTAYIVNRMLKNVMTIGTARNSAINWNITDAVGKTGTTNDTNNETKDIWFVGLTPYYVTATWYGYDEGEPLRGYGHAYGNKHPGVATWAYLMNTIQANYAPKDFPVSANVEAKTFCTISGQFPTDGCPTAVGYYKKNGINNPGVCSGVHAVEPTE